MFNRTREPTLQLVSFPSLTNTEGETRCAQHIYDLLVPLPYFQAHPNHLRTIRTLDDTHERSIVWRLCNATGHAQFCSQAILM